MTNKHQDKVAVITGAASGFGQAMAQRLAQDGADIVVADLQAADDTLNRIAKAGRQSLFCKCDVSSPESVATMAAQVNKRFGRCDILINNAGVYPLKTFDEMTFEDWRRLMSINLDAAFLTTKQFIGGMKERGWGRIINLSSSTLNTVVVDYAHYIASKGGVVGFTRALASEYGAYGITVNAISPSLARTPGVLTRAPRFGFNSIDAEFDRISRVQAIKRPMEATDLAGVASFLASDDAAFMTAQVLYVDGGIVRV